MFLSQDDIANLTGYKVPKCQIRWLQQNGFLFRVAADGKPRVLVSFVESAMGVPMKKTKRQAEPDEAALSKWMGISA